MSPRATPLVDDSQCECVQGFDLFDTDECDDNRGFHIERCDECKRWEDDDDATQACYELAVAAVAALDLLWRADPTHPGWNAERRDLLRRFPRRAP